MQVGGLLGPARPAKAGNTQLGYGSAHQQLVGTVEQALHLRTGEELELFVQLLLLRGKTGVVGRAEVGEQTFGGLDDGRQPGHFPYFRNAGFENTQRVAGGVQLPHAEGHAHLRVVGARRAADVFVWAQQLGQPFLHNGFAIGPSDGQHRPGEFRPMCCGQRLQRGQWAGHGQQPGPGVSARAAGQVGPFFYHKLAHPPGIKFGQVAVAVVAGAAQGKKHGPVRQAYPAAVEQQVVDLGRSIGVQQAAAQQGRQGEKSRE